MDIAVSFEKINLVDEKFLFKPKKIIKGVFAEDVNVFFSENGEVYSAIDGNELNDDNYFGLVTNLEELIKDYGNLDENVLYASYLYDCKQICYIGILNKDTGFIEISNIDLDFDVQEEEIEENDISIENISVKKEESKKFNYLKLKNSVLSKIVAQDQAVNDIVTAIAVNYTSKNLNHKSHMIIVGPPGTGKTKIPEIIAKEIGVPFLNVEASNYESSDKNIFLILMDLLRTANFDITEAQQGIVVINNIDKCVYTDQYSNTEFLSMVELLLGRNLITISSPDNGDISFDTSNLTFIFTGEFKDLLKSSQKNNNFGFNDSTEGINLTSKDFIKCGFSESFIKKIGVIAYTKDFTSDDIIKILYKSKQSPIREEREYFKDLGISKITFSKSFYEELAKKNVQSGIGARDLKRFTHEVLKDAYSEVLSNPKIKQLKFTKDTVVDSKKYYSK